RGTLRQWERRRHCLLPSPVSCSRRLASLELNPPPQDATGLTTYRNGDFLPIKLHCRFARSACESAREVLRARQKRRADRVLLDHHKCKDWHQGRLLRYRLFVPVERRVARVRGIP